MGEAKRRGTQNQRKLEALQHRLPTAMQYCIISDDSDEGQRAVATLLTTGPEEFRQSLAKHHARAQESGMRFFGFLGLTGASGGTAVMVDSERELLDGLVPQLMHRVVQKRFPCCFLLAVDPVLQPYLQGRVEELQPVLGPDGTLQASPTLQRLLERSAAPTTMPHYGGDPVAFDQLVFEDTATAVAPFAAIVENRREKNSPSNFESLLPFAESLPDGSLMLFMRHPDGQTVESRVLSGGWQHRGAHDKRLADEIASRDTRDPSPKAVLLDLATAVTGRRIVDTDRVQITDRESFARFIEMTIQRGINTLGDETEMYEQDDRSLLVRVVSHGRACAALTLPPAHWRVMTTTEYGEATRSFGEQLASPEGQALSEKLVQVLQHQMAAENNFNPQSVRLVVTIHDRSLESLTKLRQIATRNAAMLGEIESWLAGSKRYALIAHTPVGMLTFADADDVDELIEDHFPALRRLVPAAENALFTACCTLADDRDRAAVAWRAEWPESPSNDRSAGSPPHAEPSRIVVLCDRTPCSLNLLRGMSSAEDWDAKMGSWLAGPEAFVAACIQLDEADVELQAALNIEALCAEVLPAMAAPKNGFGPPLLVTDYLDVGSARVASATWTTRGGGNTHLNLGMQSPWHWEFTRAQIEAGASAYVNFLYEISNTRSSRLARGSASFSVAGYGDDPRELWEVPECRAFFQELWAKWPFWFFYLTPDSSVYQLMLLFLVPIQTRRATDEPGRVVMDFNDMTGVMACLQSGLDGVKRLFHDWGLDDDDPLIAAVLLDVSDVIDDVLRPAS